MLRLAKRQFLSFPSDFTGQQAKMTQANTLAFIFPIWWLSCSAILKGWMDQALSDVFAFKFTEKGLEGMLK